MIIKIVKCCHPMLHPIIKSFPGLKILLFGFFSISLAYAYAQPQSKNGWYTEGNFVPEHRIRITVTNPLSIILKEQAVVVKRTSLPFQNIPERSVAVIDPALPPNPVPTKEDLKKMGGYVKNHETNGHAIELQVDDIDKDGIWDEIFFLTDLKPNETRAFFIYADVYERGMYAHKVHAAIANYGRHTMPFMESEVLGWKLWYPHDLDFHGKRAPMLTANYEYSTNLSGYYMPWEMGTDIMTVAKTFGAGGMCLFENPGDMETPSRAYYSPFKDQGPLKDTRFSADVVCVGPLRAMVKVTTNNWNSGQGFYELEQFYTVIANKSWCLVEVKFNKFMPVNAATMFGAGIRKIMEEYKSVNHGGTVISMGKKIPARIPDEDIGDSVLMVPWEAIGMVVKDELKPTYKSINSFNGNHVFEMPVTRDLTYQYMAVGAWSFGEVNNNEQEFIKYVDTEALKYNHPPTIQVFQYELKPK